MDHRIRRDDERSRYELVVDDEVVGVADFFMVDRVMVLPHTEIDARSRGRGLGELLVKGVLEDVRARGEQIEPRCWFVAEYVERHREDADLLAS